MKHIVLDTNVLFNDPYLRKPSMVVLFSHLEDLGYRLHVPQVVVDEVVNQHRRRVREAERDLQKALKKTGSLLGRELQSPLSQKQTDSELDSYRSFVMEKLERHAATILPVPDVSSTEILERAISRRKPFDENGKGYQDTLIWYSILELAKQVEGDICLVTANTRDFAGKDGSLVNDLCHDLMKIAPASETGNLVTLFNKLDDLVSREFVPKLKSAEEVVRQIQDGTLLPLRVDDWDDLGIEMDMAISELIESEETPFGFLSSPAYQDYEFVSLSKGERHCDRVVNLDDHRLLVDLYEDRVITAHDSLGEFGSDEDESTKIRVRIIWTAEGRFRYRCVINVSDRDFETFELTEAKLLAGPDLKDEIVECEI